MSAVSETPAAASPTQVKVEGPLARFWSEFSESRLALFGLALLALIALIAIFAPWLAPQNPYDLNQLDVLDARLPPGEKSGDGKVTFWLGTDGQGRDMLSAMMYGLRISLAVGALSAVAAMALGTMVGLFAAYVGGRWEAVIMRFVDIQLGFPAILVALVLLAVLGQGVDKVLLALVIVQWAYFARTARGSALVEKGREYIEAARCLGFSSTRILFKHLLPNCMPPLIVIATIQVAEAIALEATLSFLGLGVPVTEPSLGMLIANGFNFLLSGYYWISVVPGVLLAVAIVAINLVGDQLRDVLNPRLKR